MENMWTSKLWNKRNLEVDELISQKKSPALAQVLQRLVLLRLFLPLVALSVIAIGGVGYLSEQTLLSQQQQKAQFIARIVDRYLDQAARTLDAVARVAEVSPPADLVTFMQGAWEAYGYFDTLYYLDASGKITLLAPPDPRYLGLDMSNLPYFQQTEEKNTLVISRPFISLRTGNPTVYLVRQLAGGGQVIGELSLESLQDEITSGRGAPSQDMIFIMDQSGMLLAHPSSNLVRQQTNQSYLEIFRRGLSRDATLVYEYAGTMVLGSAARVERAGWVVVDQVPLSVSSGPYAWALGLTLLASLAIWLILVWRLRSQLEQHVAIPLMQLSRGTNALANGDFSQGKALAAIPAAFAELTALAEDFQHMSDALQTRQFALQESKERYRQLANLSPDGISIHSDGRVQFVNPAMVHMSGATSADQLIGKSVLDLIHPDFREIVQNRIHKIKRSGQPTSFIEEKILRLDGTSLNVEVAAIPYNLNNTQYIQIVVRDITERKRAEESLRESGERLRQIASSLREVVWLRDVQTRQVLYVNPAFQELTGRPCESFYENRDVLIDVIHPDDKEWVLKALDQRFESVPFDKEHRITHLDGSVRWVSSRIFPVRNEAGEVYRWASIMEDITDRKRVEEEIHQLNQELEQRVTDRTAQLKAANKELEAFAYSVSHDLRAPLRHIDGFLELLQQRIGGDLDERSQHYMATVSDAAMRMGQLIDDLLAFSRMGRNELSKTPVDLNRLVQEVIGELEPEMHGRSIHWQITPLPTVTGDRATLRLVLVNLLSNALKFTRGCESTEIEIGCQVENKEAIIFIRDNGVGFDMAYADKLFGVFQRLHHADEFEGTGIGLANVRRIINRHNGRTWAEGAVSHGATFYFSLPQSGQGG
jgi:PAS domain S-box-containing protein